MLGMSVYQGKSYPLSLFVIVESLILEMHVLKKVLWPRKGKFHHLKSLKRHNLPYLSFLFINSTEILTEKTLLDNFGTKIGFGFKGS